MCPCRGSQCAPALPVNSDGVRTSSSTSVLVLEAAAQLLERLCPPLPQELSQHLAEPARLLDAEEVTRALEHLQGAERARRRRSPAPPRRRRSRPRRRRTRAAGRRRTMRRPRDPAGRASPPARRRAPRPERPSRAPPTRRRSRSREISSSRNARRSGVSASAREPTRTSPTTRSGARRASASAQYAAHRRADGDERPFELAEQLRGPAVDRGPASVQPGR